MINSSYLLRKIEKNRTRFNSLVDIYGSLKLASQETGRISTVDWGCVLSMYKLVIESLTLIDLYEDNFGETPEKFKVQFERPLSGIEQSLKKRLLKHEGDEE